MAMALRFDGPADSPLLPRLTDKAIEYPERDGKPMGETEIHIDWMIELITSLRRFFQRRLDVYVAGNMLIYYKKGDPKIFIVPDCYVVKGVSKKKRRTYKVWEEGKAPDVVFELTSRSTKNEDTNKKKLIYQNSLQVKEYFIYDPLYEYLKPPLQGYCLERGVYVPIEQQGGRLKSLELDIELADEHGFLNLYDSFTGERILRVDEKIQFEANRADQEAKLRESERKRAIAAEEALNQLKAELDALINTRR
jgi:Uma2 family endonuclease